MNYTCETCRANFNDSPSNKRRFCSRSCKEKWQSSKPELASRWKGEDGNTASIHRWINAMRGGRPSKCQWCNREPGRGKDGRAKIHWANLSRKYKRDILDWVAICISCHWRYDNKVANLRNG